MANPQSASYYQVFKTRKNILDIPDKHPDSFIITIDGKLYFDYSDDERIEISTICPPYYSDINFKNYNINSDLFIRYDNIFTHEDRHPLKIYKNSLIFDEFGNYGIIIECVESVKKCKVKIVGIISEFLLKNFTKEVNDELIANLILVKDEATNQVSIMTTKINTLTNAVIEKQLKLNSNILDVDYNEKQSRVDINLKVSDENGNALTLCNDGIYVPNILNKVYTKEEINTLIRSIKALDFKGPYLSVDKVPKPYSTNAFYLIGAGAPYQLYKNCNGTLVYIGNSEISAKDFYTKEEIENFIGVVRVS